MGWFLFIVIIAFVLSAIIRKSKEIEAKKEYDVYSRQKQKEWENLRIKEAETKKKEAEILLQNRQKIDSENSFLESEEFDISGIHYRTSAAKIEAEILEFGDEVALQFEPNNRFDPDAIKIISDRKHIGYVPSYCNKEIGQKMRKYIYKAIVLQSTTAYNEKFHDNDIIVTVKVFFIEERKTNTIKQSQPKPRNNNATVFKGKKVVITGTFNSFSREDLKSLIESKGGLVRASLSGKTNYLIKGSYDCGPEKLNKAEILKIETGLIIMEEDELIELLKK